ncbi:MAG: glycosyltransferase [Phycisphaeraceae bacterium]|nr:glycosyltransferase [Phycisphaeraceae bacterium]
MRVLFFSTMKGSPWGGSEELWHAAAMRAASDAHTVAASLFEWPGPRHQRLHELERAGVRLILRPQKRRRLIEKLAPPAWMREIAAFAPDRVCLSQGGAYEAAGRKSAHPFIRWLLASSVPLVNIVQYNDDDDDLRRSARRIARALNERAHANAFVARRNIEQASRALRQDVPRACVIRNPVNLRDTSPLPWPGDEGPARIAIVARLQSSTKGQDLLLESLCTGAWKNRDWRVSLFGSGPDGELFRAMTHQLGMQDRVTFAGQVPDVREIWRTHHALVLPSRAEGTPLAMVEAMLLARPCLVTDVGGCADWIEHGVSGWLAPRADLAGVMLGLEQMWADRPRWRGMGLTAADRAAKMHDPDPGRTLLDIVLRD